MKGLTGSTNKPGQRLIGLGFLLIILLVSEFFVWSWVKTYTLEWKQARSQDEQLRALTLRLASIERKYTEDRVTLEELTAFVPKQSEIPAVIEKLEKTAEDLKLIIKLSNITQDTNQDPIYLNIDVNVHGPAARLLHYIEQVESLVEIAYIGNWHLSAAPEGATALKPAPGAAIPYILDMTVSFPIQPLATPTPVITPLIHAP